MREYALVPRRSLCRRKNRHSGILFCLIRLRVWISEEELEDDISLVFDLAGW